MSRHTYKSNEEKGKLLATARKRLGFSQVQMAEKLNLDPTYISQLENGRREVDEFYVERAEEMALEFRKRGSLQFIPAIDEGSREVEPTRESCSRYFQQFLKMCMEDPARLGWTAVELKTHFPLDKWVPPNSVPDAVAAQAAKRAVAELHQHGVVSGRSRKAVSTSGKTSSRASRAGAPSGAPPTPPKPAPK